jgi:DNA-directed RNA polymerase subunit RPC12/RpoP
MTEEKIKCPNCGSTNVRMTDYSPLAINGDLITLGQFDNELYAEFGCFNCEASFNKTLTISL